MKEYIKIIERFSKARILVIGDVILDEYIWGDVDRISPEAPVPVVRANKRDHRPGGAANVAYNLACLGAKVSICGVVGNDDNRSRLAGKLAESSIDTRGLVTENGRHTTVKSRIFARHQQVVRVDWEVLEAVRKQTRCKLEDFTAANIGKYDAVIIEDYGKGVFDGGFLAHVIELAREHKKVITVDPKEDNFESYWGVTAITPNRKEAENAVRYLKIKDQANSFRIYKDKLLTHEDIHNAGRAIIKHLGLESLLITLGEEGMWLLENNGRQKKIPTVAQEVYDVSGAGDTVIAVFTLCLASGASKADAAVIANYAAGIVVGKVGTATTTRKELSERILRKP